jgi:hypothetical protein
VWNDEFGDCSTVLLIIEDGVESNVLHIVGFVAVITGFDVVQSASLGLIKMGFLIGISFEVDGITLGRIIVVTRLVLLAIAIDGVATVAELVIVCKVMLAFTELVGESLLLISVFI